jgi:hypothetical protein
VCAQSESFNTFNACCSTAPDAGELERYSWPVTDALQNRSVQQAIRIEFLQSRGIAAEEIHIAAPPITYAGNA